MSKKVDPKKFLLESTFKSSKEELKEVLELLEKYFFYDLLSYMIFSINEKISKGKPVADCPSGIVEYSLSLILSIKNPGEERATEEICNIFMNKIILLWEKAGLANRLMGDDSFVSEVSSYFLTIRGNDYDIHLIEYLKGLFSGFNDFFENKIGFGLNDVIELFLFSQNIDEKHPFIVNPTNEKTKNVMEFFSLEIGDNKEFLEGKYGGLFGTRSIVPERCIIKFKDNYYIFQPLLILRNIKNNFEKVLKEDNKIWEKYEKNRAKLLEEESVKYILNVLPGAKGYVNLKYDGGKETDGLIIYDNNIFIIEAKAGALRKTSTKGNKDHLDRDIEQLMLKGYSQALRTKEYIENNNEAIFSCKGEQIKIERNKANKIFLINTTGEYLGPISTHLDIQKDKRKISNKVNFWSIYINELRVISELIEFSSQFLLFLERRINLINLPKLHFADGLDIFMEFIKRGLLFDNGKIYGEDMNKMDSCIMDTTATDEIDRYYWGEGEKPKMKIESEYEKIIKSIELKNKYRFSEVSTFLLSLNQGDILKTINILKDKIQSDGKLHSCTLLFDSIRTIVLFILKKESDLLEREKQIIYSKVKLGQTSCEKAYNLYFDFKDNGDIIFNDFDIVVVDESERTEGYKQAVDYFNKNSSGYQMNLKNGKKLYRKSPCPCGSGKKFKRCCWDKYNA